MTVDIRKLLGATSFQDLLDWSRRVTEAINYNFDSVKKQVESQTAVNYIQFNIMTSPPPNPVDGMVVYADGTQWNPGSGRGLYERRNGAWYKL